MLARMRFAPAIISQEGNNMEKKSTSYQFRRYLAYAIFAALLLQANAAYAAGSGMPWEGPLDQLLQSLAGPVARVVGVAAIVVTGLGIAFGEGGGGMRKMLWVVFGLTIAFSATSFFLSFFGGAQGAAF
jgi:type IV secretion system protein TrbC